MEPKEFTLIEIVRDPGVWIYESSELTEKGHYYLYRYDSSEQIFYRATVPAGAASIHFHPLKPSQRVPLGGWFAVERKTFRAFRPRLVPSGKSMST